MLGEPGAARVRQAIGDDAAISAVNWAEVLSRLADLGLDPIVEARRLRAAGDLFIAPFDDAQAAEVARLRPLTKHLGLSLGDRACLALGQVLGLPVLSADQTWAGLQVGVEVEVIR